MNTLPCNDDLERQVVGQCLLDGKITNELEPSDFYNPIWRECWSVMKDLDVSGQQIEALTVANMINQKNKSWDLSVIVNSTFGLVHAYSPDQWAKQIKNYAVRRFLIKQLHSQIEYLENSDDIGECVSRLEKKIDFIRTDYGAKDDRFVSLEQIIEQEVKPALHELQEKRTGKIKTGFDALDKIIGGGLSVSDVVIVAAPPGKGKSAFVLQLAYQIAKQNVPVAFLSCEMTNKENGFRLLSQASDFTNLNSLTHISSDQLQFLLEWCNAIKGLPISMDHKTCDVHTLSSLVRSLVRQKQIKILIVDYIQLLKLEKIDTRKRHERITEASQEMKRLANELEICVIEVAQFNREGAKSTQPSMHDLEASGQLEKDTSLIFILDLDEQTKSNATLRIVKGRNTGCGKLEGYFKGPSLWFTF